MKGGGVGRRAGDATRRPTPRLAAVLLLGLVSAPLRAEDGGSEVRVLSGPGASSAITIRTRPEVRVDDRTPGARPATGTVASRGEAFTGEVTLFLHQHGVARPATVEVADPVVSAVRLFPEKGGTTVAVFVRQPVTYTVWQPSAAGEVRVELRGTARPVTVTTTPRGTQKTKRPEATGPDEVAVDAESLSYDQQTNTLTARGGVTLTRGDTTLTADEVLYDRTNEVAQAKGHVVMIDPQATVTGSFAHLNLDDESGWVETADAKLQPTGYSLLAGRLEKQGGPRYSVANGVFTTCECGGLERPSWSIAARQTDVQLQGRGVARGMTFRLKDVPVLYLPYFVFPAANDRQSGFLMPRLGYSNRRGFQYEQPFFWAISKSTDATIGVDLETAARVGVIGEYRYLLSREVQGHLVGAYYNQQIGGISQGTTLGQVAPDDKVNRFLLAGQHSQPFYGDSHLYLTMFAVSDDDFLRDINTFAFVGGREVALRTTRFTTSRAEVLKTWEGGLLSADTTYHQDLIDPQTVTLQRLPNLLTEHSVPVLGDRLIARVGAEATDFWRDEGFDGLRADLVPEVFLPFHLGTVLSGSVTGQLRETAYHLFDRSQVAVVQPTGTCAGGRKSGEVCTTDDQCPGGKCNLRKLDEDFESFRALPGAPQLEENRTRELGSIQGRVGTTFQRVFDFPHLGLARVMHTIEPEVQYLFVPQAGRPTATFVLPSCGAIEAQGRRAHPGVNCDATLFSEEFLFDERDAINKRDFLSYGLTTRLFGRPLRPADPVNVPAGGEVPAPSASDATGGDTAPAVGTTSPAPPAVAPRKPAAPVEPPRELLRASVLQGYDISRSLVGTSHQSDVDLGLRLTPTDYVTASYNTTVNLGKGQLRGQSVGLQLREPGWTAPTQLHGLQSPTALGVSYRFVEKNVNLGPQESLLFRAQGVNEVDGGVYLRLGNYLGFTFLSRYTLDTTQAVQTGGQIETLGPHFLERDYILRLISRCNCWSVDVGVADKFNPDERLFRIQFTLVGLGAIGQGQRIPNYVGVGPASQTGPGGRRGVGTGGAFY